MSDTERIDQIRERAEAAPTGPLSAVLNTKRTWNYILVFGGTDDEYLLAKVADDDATALMVNARDDTLWLLDRLRTAEAELIEVHNHFAIQEGRTREAFTRAAEAEAVIAEAPHAPDCRCSCRCGEGHSIAECRCWKSRVTSDDLARVKAEAWDEGRTWTAQRATSIPAVVLEAPNPYRAGANHE